MNELALVWILMVSPSIMDKNHAEVITTNPSSYEVCLFTQIVAEIDTTKHYYCAKVTT
jgi:hypothetical protein